MNIRTFKDGDVTFIEAKFDSFSVTLSNLGASIFEIKNKDDLLTLTPKKNKDFFRGDFYAGKTIGPLANRVKDSVLDFGTFKRRLRANEGYNLLHSGYLGLSNKLFEFDYTVNNGVLLVNFTKSVGHIYDDFSGNRTFKITYEISENTSLNINLKFNANSDRLTLFRLTNHTYFSLGENDVKKLWLKMPSKQYIYPDDEDLCPLRIEPLIESLNYDRGDYISKSVLDKDLCSVRSNGLDHYIFFDNSKSLILRSEKFQLDIDTDFEGVQFYSDNYPDGVPCLNGKGKCHRALAVEPSDSNLNFDLVNSYHRFINYKISKL